MRIALAVAVLFGTRFAVTALYYPLKDADLAWQRWLGERILASHSLPAALGAETFTAGGAPWIPQEWLLSLAVASTLPYGRFAWLALALAAVAAATIVLVAWNARRRGAPVLGVALTSACVGASMIQSFGVRAQVGGWFALALFLLLLEAGGAWTAYAAIGVVVLWANVHASVMLAPVLAAIWTIGAFLDDGRCMTPRVRRGVTIAVASALATCASPLGWHLPVYAVQLMESPIRQSISEWQHANLGDVAFDAGVVSLVLAAFAMFWRGERMAWRDTLLFLFAFALALNAVRNVPIAAIVMAGPVAAMLSGGMLSGALSDRGRAVTLLRERGVAALLAVATIVCAFGILARFERVGGVTSLALPNPAITRAAALPGVRRLYCEDFAWCSLALEHENLRTFVDGRCDPFPAGLWNVYLGIRKTANGWQGEVAHFRIDTILAARGRPLATALLVSRDWHIVWHDPQYTLFAKI